jgi:hypothetical protein
MFLEVLEVGVYPEISSGGYQGGVSLSNSQRLFMAEAKVPKHGGLHAHMRPLDLERQGYLRKLSSAESVF